MKHSPTPPNPTQQRAALFLEKAILDMEEQTAASTGLERNRLHSRLRSLRKRLARLRGRHTEKQWVDMVYETAGICVRCGYQHEIAADWPYKGYIVPIALGGSDSIDNIQPLCRSCISSKKDEQINWLAIWREHQGA